ncbi:MAG: aldo/keto reductase [Propionibacteriaceae bacterium]|jgi:predicted oxidoreductase|nr:aldo/keto reductase [Propionibacteriaceae bacterium]
MKTISLSGADLVASNVILGQMRIWEKTDDEIRALARAGLEAGVNMVDHADIYGGGVEHRCEERFAQALQLTPSQRSQLIIQTKCGINLAENYFDFSAQRILTQVEGSLKALQTDYIDILLLHRPDALVEPEEVAQALDQLHRQGKVLHFGVSNHTPNQIELLKTAVTQPLIVNQLQLSIPHSSLVAAPLAANMANLDQSIDRDNGLLDYCRIHHITVQAWSPFQHGFFRGTFLGDRENFAALNDVLDRLAAQYQVTPLAIATAWILRHPARPQVVLGTTRPDRVREACAGSDLVLTRPEWYELFKAAGHRVP